MVSSGERSTGLLAPSEGGALEVLVKTYLVSAAGEDLAAKGVFTRVVSSDSGIGGGVAATVTSAEVAAEGVGLVLVEVEVVRGTSGLRTEVTVAVFLALVALEGRALR